jgi:sirohydrochlorin cobaltochelatase
MTRSHAPFRLAIAGLLAVCLFHGAVEAQQQSAPAPKTGILIMAHGGMPEWDQAVAEAVIPLKDVLPTTLALGMADPVTMQAALDSLQNEGVEKVAVVRLFLSGESFIHDTEFYLGLRDDPPAMPMAMMMAHGSGAPHVMGPIEPLDLSADILLEMRGLSEATTVASIVADRARAVSVDPSRESVIVIAHGMGDEGENQRVLDNMASSLELLRANGFRDAHAATLREDWPEARVQAEADIRGWVESRTARGDRVLVVPFRLFGFGGYAEVLDGLTYTPADGLLPHELVSTWIAESATGLFCSEGIASPLGACEAVSDR